MQKRYLITGVAGSGKTTLRTEFQRKGYVTADIDEGFAEWRHADTDELLSYTPEDKAWHIVAEWVVDKDKLQKFFDNHASDTVLVFGSFARMGKVVPLFSKLILLEYPNLELARARIAGRKGGYGKNSHELDRILSYVQPYQNKMRAAGATVISCDMPLSESIATIENILKNDR